MKVGITGVAIQPCSLMCLEVIFEGIDHQQLLTYCASDTEALWYLSSDVPAVEMLECHGMSMFMLTLYSCWLFCLLSVCWICHISCLSVECSKVNRIKHSFKSKQAKKIANDMFSVLLSISFHVNVSIGEKKQHAFIKSAGLCRARPRSGWQRLKEDGRLSTVLLSD